VAANGNIELTWHTPSPFTNVSFNGTYYATAAITMDVIVTPQGNGNFNIGVNGSGASNVDVSLQIGDIPLPDSIFGIGLPDVPGLPSDSIDEAITDTVSTAIGNVSFQVYTLSTAVAAGSGLTLTLANLAVTQISGPDGAPLLTVTATPTLVPTPH
jgi:hypothetical protein